MKTKIIKYKPIGVIHSPFKDQQGTPIQAKFAAGTKGVIELFNEFCEGLEGLEAFSHLILLYHFHKAKGFNLKTKPYLEDVPRGVFALRGPRRPNAIGITVVELERIVGNKLYIKNLDILDGTPLLDIKPYIHYFDVFPGSKAGWLEGHDEKLSQQLRISADNRFNEKE
ncbi:MAG: tRNA (N6-threonylcarbamoyladenosine(37)-N6)-methyltransferase TrmO [Candidatus Heimdallarchaeota archaeon]|nr:tRNA (N6-threonylcarbamoyladenosine(37)-N6)-methyltransferase TrmO [Candidatus Heimdallarchaeota archaeon]